MEPPPAKPPRKRRRWLIVAFVLVLVSLVSWWYWPLGDARFVGKWSMSGSDLIPYAHWELFANGSARETTLADGEAPSFPWRCERGALVLGTGPSGLDYGPLRNVFDSVERLIGWYPFVPTQEWMILSISAEEFVVKPKGVTKPIHFRRISE